MKVLDLRCAHDHRFEGWFASEEDFLSQQDRKLVACPVCEDKNVIRMPSAPRINISTTRGEQAPPATPDPQASQGMIVRAIREMIQKSEDVGDRFPEEARRMHYGESEERSIRGRASAEDAESLRDEGIEFMAIPMPEAPSH